MIQSPIAKVLSLVLKSRVRCLLMGGQACILYGAAEFSRDIDLAVLAAEKNLERLRRLLDDLQAEPVFFPALDLEALRRGHACHFRCRVTGAEDLRVDIMSVLRGCDDFRMLWKRRQKLAISGVGTVAVLALPDLVKAKKTQRDKDWPMIRRLVEADFQKRPKKPSPKKVDFWLREARTPSLLVEVAQSHPRKARTLLPTRPLLRLALEGKLELLEAELHREEQAIRSLDRDYWQPLREELFALRQVTRGMKGSQ